MTFVKDRRLHAAALVLSVALGLLNLQEGRWAASLIVMLTWFVALEALFTIGAAMRESPLTIPRAVTLTIAGGFVFYCLHILSGAMNTGEISLAIRQPAFYLLLIGLGIGAAIQVQRSRP